MLFTEGCNLICQRPDETQTVYSRPGNEVVIPGLRHLVFCGLLSIHVFKISFFASYFQFDSCSERFRLTGSRVFCGRGSLWLYPWISMQIFSRFLKSPDALVQCFCKNLPHETGK